MRTQTPFQDRLYHLALFLFGQLRVLHLRALGLRLPASVKVGRRIHWPVQNLSRLHIGERVALGSGIMFCITPDLPDSGITIGDGSHLSRGCVLSAASRMVIGRNCRIGYNVGIMDQVNMPDGTSEARPITIGDNVFIGANSVIQPGATIEPGCIIGPNLSISSRIPADNVVGLSPKIYGDKRHLPHQLVKI
jgi:acetyltransferase-like isoleucine patch superfamily enzyme